MSILIGMVLAAIYTTIEEITAAILFRLRAWRPRRARQYEFN